MGTIMKYIVETISGWLINNDAIENSDRELYEYAVQVFLLSIIPFVIFLIASGMIGMLSEGMLIILPFMVMRKYSGGYHARHAYTCMTVSVGLLLSCFYVVLHVDYSYYSWIFHILTVISGLSIVTNSPIDSENRKLEKEEIIQYKHITCILVTIHIASYFVLCFLHKDCYAVCLACSFILLAVMQMPCVLKKRNK